uniref:Putative galactinol--sucrose galactosyltransferase 1 n=1 Tax=Noccaea caerulescens TaxID=107243 RepID=A0A1J3FNG6_NOCCA
MIDDDGWQSVGMDESIVEFNADNCCQVSSLFTSILRITHIRSYLDVSSLISCASFSFANRFTRMKENHKFQKDGKEGHRIDNPVRRFLLLWSSALCRNYVG